MNVDFLESFDAFVELTQHHRQKLWFVDKEGTLTVRAGRFGFRAAPTNSSYDKALAWCRAQAYKVETSLPEELVFA